VSARTPLIPGQLGIFEGVSPQRRQLGINIHFEQTTYIQAFQGWGIKNRDFHTIINVIEHRYKLQFHTV